PVASVSGARGRWDYDVAVIGGGPGGSTPATALGRRGRTVVCLERAGVPRHTLAASGFIEKWGASFRGPDGQDERYADFQTAPETPTPQTFQVLRERFDEILLRHSEKSGARVLEEHRLLDARFDSDGVTLSFTDRHGGETALRAGVVVDASGRTGVLAKRFGRHEYDPLLRNIAVHAQYEGIPRAAGRRAGDIRMFTRPDMGWLWFIPLSETVISVGAVIPQVVHRRESRATPEESLAHYLAATPAAAPLPERARRGPPEGVAPARAPRSSGRKSGPLSGRDTGRRAPARARAARLPRPLRRRLFLSGHADGRRSVGPRGRR